MSKPTTITTYVVVPIVMQRRSLDGVERYQVDGYDEWDDASPGDFGDTFVVDDSHPDGGYWESDYKAQALAAEWIAIELRGK